VFYDVYHDHQGGVVEVLVIRQKDEAMKWLTEYGRQTE
jgi:hypothetical protein